MESIKSLDPFAKDHLLERLMFHTVKQHPLPWKQTSALSEEILDANNEVFLYIDSTDDVIAIMKFSKSFSEEYKEIVDRIMKQE